MELDKPMTLGDHIDELRVRILHTLIGVAFTFIVCLFLGKRAIGYVKGFYVTSMVSQGLRPYLQTLSPSDGFVMYIKISLVSGLFLAAPWIFYQLWKYVAVGLRPSERHLTKLGAFMSSVLFVVGGGFFLKIVAPLVLRFFIVFNKNVLGIESSFTFEKYITFIAIMIFVFGLAFQTPTFVLLLIKVGVVTLDSLRKSRKYVLLGVFILACIATPPDFVSQLALAVPLYLLFELGILLGRTMNLKGTAESG